MCTQLNIIQSVFLTLFNRDVVYNEDVTLFAMHEQIQIQRNVQHF